MTKREQSDREILERRGHDLDDDAIEIFLELENWRLSSAERTNDQEAHESGYSQDDALEAVRRLWRRMDGMTDLPWPTSEELASDNYDGAESIAAYHARRATTGAAKSEESRAPGSSIWKMFPCWLGDALRGRSPKLASVALVLLILIAFGFGTMSAGTLYETGVAEHRRVVLQDGSVVYLGAASRLEVIYSAKSRRLVLSDGEAYFTVAKDEHRPFTVESGLIEVRAVGTAFNLRHGAESVIVSVIEGVVEIFPDTLHRSRPSPSKPVQFVAGDQVNFTESDATLRVEKLDRTQALAWQRDVLIFSGEPLRDVIASINRYTTYDVVIEDPAVRAIRFSGTIHRVNIDQWFEAAPQLFPIEVQRQDGRILLFSRPSDEEEAGLRMQE